MRVAVEANLSPVSDYLSSQGYQVDLLDDAKNVGTNNGDYAAVVISGADQNLMGVQNVAMDCPVINASGLTPQEVHQRIQNAAKLH